MLNIIIQSNTFVIKFKFYFRFSNCVCARSAVKHESCKVEGLKRDTNISWCIWPFNSLFLYEYLSRYLYCYCLKNRFLNEPASRSVVFASTNHLMKIFIVRRIDTSLLFRRPLN